MYTFSISFPKPKLLLMSCGYKKQFENSWLFNEGTCGRFHAKIFNQKIKVHYDLFVGNKHVNFSMPNHLTKEMKRMQNVASKLMITITQQQQYHDEKNRREQIMENINKQLNNPPKSNYKPRIDVCKLLNEKRLRDRKFLVNRPAKLKPLWLLAIKYYLNKLSTLTSRVM